MKKGLYIIGRVLLLNVVLWFSGRENFFLENSHTLLLVFSILIIISSLTEALFGKALHFTTSKTRYSSFK